MWVSYLKLEYIVFWKNQVSTTITDTLAPCVVRISSTIVFYTSSVNRTCLLRVSIPTTSAISFLGNYRKYNHIFYIPQNIFYGQRFDFFTDHLWATFQNMFNTCMYLDIAIVEAKRIICPSCKQTEWKLGFRFFAKFCPKWSRRCHIEYFQWNKYTVFWTGFCRDFITVDW